MSQIICKNLVVGYGSNHILSNLTFNIEKGDYFCIVGENGVGKSTLMRTLLGLQKPLSGEMVLSSQLKQNGIGYVPQQLNVQKDFPATIVEIVRTGIRSKNIFYKKEEKKLVDVYLAKFGLYEYRDRQFKDLSGGQQQRVLLMRALCATKEILLLDEPTTGLDVLSSSMFIDFLGEINKQGITIVMISHDLEFVKDTATKVLRLDCSGGVLDVVSR